MQLLESRRQRRRESEPGRGRGAFASGSPEEAQHEVALARRGDRLGGGGGERSRIRIRKTHPGRGGGEPREMLRLAERRAVVDAQSLEDRAAAQHALVVRVEHGAVDGLRTAAELDDREQRHRSASTSGAPIAASSGRAFTHDSSTSSAGSESQTMPPPTQRWISPSATANVRIVSARSRSPFG